MILFDDSWRLLASQDVNKMPCPVTLMTFIHQPENSRQQFLRGNRPVPGVGWGQTIITITAKIDRLAKVLQQSLTATPDRFAKTQHRIKLLP